MKIAAVLLLCVSIAIVTNSCKKKKSSPPFPLNYTSKMGGTRYWSGFYVHKYVDTFVSPTIVHIDTTYFKDTFAVVIMDYRTIQMPNIMHDPGFDPNFDLYHQYDSTNTIIFSTFNSYNLSYNYQDNSMNYIAELPGDTLTGPGMYDLLLHTP